MSSNWHVALIGKLLDNIGLSRRYYFSARLPPRSAAALGGDDTPRLIQCGSGVFPLPLLRGGWVNRNLYGTAEGGGQYYAGIPHELTPGQMEAECET